MQPYIHGTSLQTDQVQPSTDITAAPRIAKKLKFKKDLPHNKSIRKSAFKIITTGEPILVKPPESEPSKNRLSRDKLPVLQINKSSTGSLPNFTPHKAQESEACFDLTQPPINNPPKESKPVLQSNKSSTGSLPPRNNDHEPDLLIDLTEKEETSKSPPGLESKSSHSQEASVVKSMRSEQKFGEGNYCIMDIDFNKVVELNDCRYFKGEANATPKSPEERRKPTLVPIYVWDPANRVKNPTRMLWQSGMFWASDGPYRRDYPVNFKYITQSELHRKVGIPVQSPS